MDELLIKYLLGETNPDEAVRVSQWIMEDAGNRIQYERLKAVWEISGRNISVPMPEIQQALRRLKQRIHTPASSAPQAIYRLLRTWRAAAVFAGVICISGVAYWMANRTVKPSVAAAKKVNPVHTEDPGPATSAPSGLQTDLAGKSARVDTLPDGSVVTLDKHAGITYPSGLKEGQRAVTLHGDAFFSVVHNPSRPFVVYANDLTIKVLGTSFSIRRIDGHTEVAVRSGVVSVTRGTDSVVLHHGEKIAFQDQKAGHREKKTGIEDHRQIMRQIIEDMVRAKIIADKDSVSWFGLDNRQFVVDGRPVSDSLHRIFRSKYIRKDGLGYYYGPVKVYGQGFFYDKKDLYQHQETM